ncbi:hypothetical protein WA588_000800, partial [Blastocystis sp. NMH]
MNSLHLALQNAKEKQSSRKEKTILTLNNNDPFSNAEVRRRETTKDSSKVPSIYSIARPSKVGIEYALSFCDYSHPAYDNVTSICLNSKLLTDQGLSMLYSYLSLGFYPHLSLLRLEDNLLTDNALNILSQLIQEGMCPELSEIHLTYNYINQGQGSLFLDYCSEHGIRVALGGIPDFSLAPLLPPSQPPFLAYRVITKGEDDGSASSSSFHYSDIRTANQWVSDGNKPIIGIQLFYYGMGMMAVRLTDVNKNVVVSSGECGQLLVTNQQVPVVSMECGYRDSNYKILGITNASEGLV